ncbi:MAG: hypothetical protein GF364_03870 [Candidatus Lokiarchaeota archaeon]|nr:hypothetical protein [Candidatus Lokiarchaeota archaeon]
MSEEKKIAIILRQPPHGTLYPVEGLRMTVALSGDMEPITIVMGDGVYAFLKKTDRSMYQMHYDFIKDIELDVIVDKKCIANYGISTEDLVDGLQIKEHEEVLKIITSMDTVIAF